jgi:hypothetical protein
METSMTATIEPAQAHGLTDRAKTPAGVSTRTKSRPEDTTAFDFASPRKLLCPEENHSGDQSEYLSVNLDDSSFAATL